MIAVSNRDDSPTTQHQPYAFAADPCVLTVHSINLDQVLDHRFIGSRARPVKRDGIGLNSCKGDFGGIWDFDT